MKKIFYSGYGTSGLNFEEIKDRGYEAAILTIMINGEIPFFDEYYNDYIAELNDLNFPYTAAAAIVSQTPESAHSAVLALLGALGASSDPTINVTRNSLPIFFDLTWLPETELTDDEICQIAQVLADETQAAGYDVGFIIENKQKKHFSAAFYSAFSILYILDNTSTDDSETVLNLPEDAELYIFNDPVIVPEDAEVYAGNLLRESLIIKSPMIPAREDTPTPPTPTTPSLTPEQLDDFEVVFYQYNGKPNVINKLAASLKLAKVKVQLFNESAELNFNFKLDQFYDANYCCYSFNGRRYFARIASTTKSRNNYYYSTTIDALTTAFYFGMISGYQPIKYSNLGNPLYIDDRLSKSPTSSVRTLQLDIGDEYPVFILNVYSPQIASPFNAQQSIFTTKSFMFTDAATLNVFLDSFTHLNTDAEQKAFGTAILKLYAVPCPIDYSTWDENTSIRLYRCQSNTLLTAPLAEVTEERVSEAELVSVNEEWLDISLGAGRSDKCRTVPKNKILFVDVNYDLPAGGIDLTPEEFTNPTKFWLSPFGDGEINFSSWLTGTHITQLGWRIFYDFIGAKVRAVLKANNTIYEECFFEFPIAEQIAFLTDQSLSNHNALSLNQLAASTESSKYNKGMEQIFYNYVSGVAKDAISTLTSSLSAKDPASAGVIGAGGVVGNAILDGFGTRLNVDQKNIEHSAFLEQNQIERQQIAYQEAAQSSVMIGSFGSSMLRCCFGAHLNSRMYLRIFSTIDRTQYQAIYGKPDGHLRLFEDLPQGYAQTADAQFVANNYPLTVVEAAEQSANAGFFII